MQQPAVALAPNGDILTTNAGDGNIVETTPAGQQLTAQAADKKTGAGSLFGIVLNPAANGHLLRRRRRQHPQATALIRFPHRPPGTTPWA
jgi:hypothetical protein